MLQHVEKPVTRWEDHPKGRGGVLLGAQEKG
jgi:hypothetical protein